VREDEEESIHKKGVLKVLMKIGREDNIFQQ
jgi:hypothetical protein